MKWEAGHSRVSKNEPQARSARFRGLRRLSRRTAQVLAAAAVAAALAGGDRSTSAQGTAQANLSVSANVTRNCTITTQPINFGDINVLLPSPVDQTGAITITCTTGTPAWIELSDGGHTQTGGQRAMSGPSTQFLLYELFQDIGRTTRWGAGTGQTVNPEPAPSNAPRSFTVYGRVLGNQASVSQGAYNDVVVATVHF